MSTTTVTSKNDSSYKAKFHDQKNSQKNKERNKNDKPYKRYHPIFYRISMSRGEYDEKTMERIEKIVNLITSDRFINTFDRPDIIKRVLNDKTITFKMTFVRNDELHFDAYYGKFYIGVSLNIKYAKSTVPGKDLDIYQNFFISNTIYEDFINSKRKEQA